MTKAQDELGALFPVTGFDSMTKVELVAIATAQQQSIQALMREPGSQATYISQRRAASFVAAKVAEALEAADGTPGPLLQGFLDAASGKSYTARCATHDCDNRGSAIVCAECGEPATIELPADWKAADALMAYAVPKAEATVESLSEEFLTWVSDMVMEEFDAANQHDSPSERKQAFIEGIRRRMAGGADAPSSVVDGAVSR